MVLNIATAFRGPPVYRILAFILDAKACFYVTHKTWPCAGKPRMLCLCLGSGIDHTRFARSIIITNGCSTLQPIYRYTRKWTTANKTLWRWIYTLGWKQYSVWVHIVLCTLNWVTCATAVQQAIFRVRLRGQNFVGFCFFIIDCFPRAADRAPVPSQARHIVSNFL